MPLLSDRWPPRDHVPDALVFGRMKFPASVMGEGPPETLPVMSVPTGWEPGFAPPTYVMPQAPFVAPFPEFSTDALNIRLLWQ